MRLIISILFFSFLWTSTLPAQQSYRAVQHRKALKKAKKSRKSFRGGLAAISKTVQFSARYVYVECYNGLLRASQRTQERKQKRALARENRRAARSLRASNTVVQTNLDNMNSASTLSINEPAEIQQELERQALADTRGSFWDEDLEEGSAVTTNLEELDKNRRSEILLEKYKGWGLTAEEALESKGTRVGNSSNSESSMRRYSYLSTDSTLSVTYRRDFTSGNDKEGLGFQTVLKHNSPIVLYRSTAQKKATDRIDLNNFDHRLLNKLFLDTLRVLLDRPLYVKKELNEVASAYAKNLLIKRKPKVECGGVLLGKKDCIPVRVGYYTGRGVTLSGGIGRLQAMTYAVLAKELATGYLGSTAIKVALQTTHDTPLGLHVDLEEEPVSTMRLKKNNPELIPFLESWDIDIARSFFVSITVLRRGEFEKERA